MSDAEREARDIIVKQREAIHALIQAWPGGHDSVSFAGVVCALRSVVAPIEWEHLGGSPPMGRCGYEQFEPDNTSTPITEQEALEGINAIRNSIIGAQAWNWSEHGYPLVSLLNRAGYEGLPYPEAKKNIGALIDRASQAEERERVLRGALKKNHAAIEYARSQELSGRHDWLDDQPILDALEDACAALRREAFDA
jgi:hypothetical protein